MIDFKDFNIKVTKSAGMLSDPEFEPLAETMLRLNGWIEKNEIIVLNVETLLMPNIYKGYSNRTSSSGAYKVLGDESTWWYQIYRVWYQA